MLYSSAVVTGSANDEIACGFQSQSIQCLGPKRAALQLGL